MVRIRRCEAIREFRAANVRLAGELSHYRRGPVAKTDDPRCSIVGVPATEDNVRKRKTKIKRFQPHFSSARTVQYISINRSIRITVFAGLRVVSAS